MIPKVLILNQPFNNNTGGGITLSNLFNNWPKNKIAVVCYQYLLSNVDTGICNKYYQLGHKEYKFIFPFNILKRKHYSGELNFDNFTVETYRTDNANLRKNIIVKYFIPLIKYLRIINSISKIEISDKLSEWLTDFNPDVIYAQATNREGVKFILKIQSILKKPLVFHMMDDWPGILNDKGVFNIREQKKNDYFFRKMVEKANVLMVISNEMAKEYQSRYRKSFLTFHNSINIDFWSKYQKKDYNLSKSPSILYAGRTGLGIESSLILIAEAIERLNNDLKLSIRFVLQTRVKPKWSSKYSCVEHKSFVDYSELPKVFSNADFLILPYDFSLESIEFIGFSMPTKAPEYMISGTPIILFAPKETAIVKYALEYKFAKVITENNAIILQEGIKEFILNKEVRQRTACNAIKTAQINHASIKVQTHFKEIICSLNKTKEVNTNI